jgi:hypothetical protein
MIQQLLGKTPASCESPEEFAWSYKVIEWCPEVIICRNECVMQGIGVLLLL